LGGQNNKKSQMKYFDERIIRDKFDVPTNKMLDLWHTLSKEKFGNKIEVVMVERKYVPQLAQFKGELYTAFPTNELIKGKTVLAVIINSINDVKQIIVSHEIGHWVLNLQGFIGLSYNSNPLSDEAVLFNTALQHPALYKLQISLGHDPHPEINSRLEHNIALFSKQGERKPRKDRLVSSFLPADDLLNSTSEPLKQKLKEVLKAKHPFTLKLLNIILNTASHYDLTNPDANRKFAHKLIKNLKMQVSLWKEVDNTKKLADMLQNSGG